MFSQPVFRSNILTSLFEKEPQKVESSGFELISLSSYEFPPCVIMNISHERNKFSTKEILEISIFIIVFKKGPATVFRECHTL